MRPSASTAPPDVGRWHVRPQVALPRGFVLWHTSPALSGVIAAQWVENQGGSNVPTEATRIPAAADGLRLFFSVGEPSGDLHGANLIRALTELAPGTQCVGYGGPRMQAAGAELHADLTRLAVMWFARVLLHIREFWKLLWQADRYLKQHRPDAVVLIDYPGFNWWIARRAKAHGIPVLYYGAPQMWAWAGWRIRKMRRLVDHVLCKLAFEAEWYCERGCQATHVGHPYFDAVDRHQLDAAFVTQLERRNARFVALLPGSRTQEVEANLVPFLQTAQHILKELPTTRFAVAAYNETQATFARQQVERLGVDIPVYRRQDTGVDRGCRRVPRLFGFRFP